MHLRSVGFPLATLCAASFSTAQVVILPAAAAAAMRDSGATRVEAWVVARTPPPKAR